MQTESKGERAGAAAGRPERQVVERESSRVLPRTMDIGIDAGR